MTNVSKKQKDKAPFLSYLLMGWGNLRAGQIVRGILYLLLEIAFLVFMVTTGARSLQGLITLGTNQQGMVFNEEIGIYERIDGDNSMLLLLGGVVTLFVIVFFLFLCLFCGRF